MVGEHIYKLRKKKGLSQEDLASELGVSRQTISNWESDQTAPDLKQAAKLAEIFEVSLDELVGKEKVISVKVETKKEPMSFGKGIAIVIAGLAGFILLITLLTGISGWTKEKPIPEIGDEDFDETITQYQPVDASKPTERVTCTKKGETLMFHVEKDPEYGVIWQGSTSSREDLITKAEAIVEDAKENGDDEVDLLSIRETIWMLFTQEGFTCQITSVSE
ncbi:helix-turn-helix transcriptional regulator [Breznakia pachnodae]|uniref:Transcriptional regulator with XRE-family HTH domain n=1 Tax=Breznakia pachnodae TaxID=265178 RepID=A0ABU0E470_9FIRM|nr:helix-turn-helix transcriptional regulator [Breznakia pachnodae]MDQ0361692.1 transcriptional regulator with XRE-family HTH domain [Breznakia pachnodae]